MCYLDSAATTLKPPVVIEAMSHFMEHEYATVHRCVYEKSLNATQRYSEVRQKVAYFIHAARPEEIVFTKGTTDGLNLLASTLNVKDEYVLISELEHHSNIVPWQLNGAKVLAVRLLPSGNLDMDHFDELLRDYPIKVMSIAHISNLLGTLHPIEEMIAKAKEKGIITIIDGAQAPSHIPIDVQKLGCDFYLFSGHKMYGPTGIGVLYGRYTCLEALPPYQGGGDMIDEVTLTHTTYQEPPLRFEAGTPPITEVIGLGAAIDYIESYGLEQIKAHEEALMAYAIEKLPQIKIIGNPKQRIAIIPFTIDGVHPMDLGALMGDIAFRTGHMCAQPALKVLGHTSICRISFGIYNTPSDIDLFVSSLHSNLSALTGLSS